MSIAEKLLTVAENEQKVAQLNNQLSECLGSGTMGLLNENVAQTISDFNDIKIKLIENGIDVPDDTKTSEYADKIDGVYDKGYDNGYYTGKEDGKIEGWAEGYDEGYTFGFEEGANSVDNEEIYTEGWNDGWDTGYTEGMESGYNAGYDVGIAEADARYNEGWNDGHGSGYGEGYYQGNQEGKAEGKIEAYNDFWDGYQSMGGRTDYRWECIGSHFIVDRDTTPRWNFTPKYNVKVNNGNAMFRAFNSSSSGGVNHQGIYIDLTQHFEDLGVELDTSGLTDAQAMFYNAQGIKRIPVINLSKCTAANTLANFIGQMGRSVTIDGIISSEKTNWASTTFDSNNPLTHCIFSGVIGKNFNIKNATKIDKESLLSILDCLKDLTDTGTSLTCTLGTTNLAKLTDDEKAIATEKGWTLA